MPSKPVNVSVTTMDAELEFAIQPNTTGKQLFDQVVKTIGLREIWYFGLQYTDTKGYDAWLKLSKKVLSQEVKREKENALSFKFRAKFYPEDVAEEIIQDITLRLFYLQVKESILKDRVYCSAETSVLLASYAMQAKYGDYNPGVHEKGCLENDTILPSRVVEQYKLSKSQWEDRIMVWWSEQKGMGREAAMLEFLKIAQDLEMYGVNFFEIKNKKGTELYLGVDALGLNIYPSDDKLRPRIGFPWSEIRNIAFNDKKFVIKPIDKKSPDFVFYAPRLRINKRILALCMGNHELYMRRRKADTIEVQQMKAQAKEEKAHKEMERERLAKEVAAREAAESKQREYETRMRQMQSDMERAQRDLLDAQATISALEEQLRDSQDARLRLEQKEAELSELTDALKNQRELAVEEREKLAEEIRLRSQEMDGIRTEVEQKDAETERLRSEVAEAQRKQQEATQKIVAASSASIQESRRHAQAEHNGAAFHENNQPPVQHVHYGDGYSMLKEFDHDLDGHPNGNGDTNVELSHPEGEVEQPELERITAMERNRDMQAKLEELSAELATEHKPEAATAFDKLHMENKRAGRDKYKTLRQIRGGNTKRRIDMYENMI